MRSVTGVWWSGPGLEAIVVFAEQFADGGADLVVGLIRQVGKRYADGHVRRVEATAVHQHDGLLFGKPPHEVDAFVVACEPLAELWAVPRSGEFWDVDGRVIVGVEGCLWVCFAERLVERLEPLDDNVLTVFLVHAFLIGEA